MDVISESRREVIMRIDRSDSADKITTIRAAGRLDTVTSPEFRAVVADVPQDVTRIVIDLADLDYISSAGLRELLICRKRFPDDRMLVENVRPEVLSVLETTGMDSILPIKTGSSDDRDYTGVSFAGFLEKKVKTSPDSVAVNYKDLPYTWADIDIGSDIMAQDLAALGVGKGTHVAVCGVNSINWIMMFFAIHKLGALAMLINPGQRAPEIARTAVIGDAVAVCCGDLAVSEDADLIMDECARIPESRVSKYYYFGNSEDILGRAAKAGEIKKVVGIRTEADDPCVMIFTSGSTGRPKGVLLSSYNILNAAVNSSVDQHLTSDDRTCLILPLFHIFGLVAGLMANAIADSLICIPADIRTSTLLDVIESRQCTVFHSVPTMLIALMNNRDFAPERLSSIRCTIISACAATEAQIREFKRIMPENHFLSSYGLSEMAPVSITEYDDTEDHVLHTVGRPVKNIRIGIFDPVTGEECPTGIKGEIYVQGYNQMMGYYKISLEDQSIDEEGWLHTGDLGYLNEDGYLCLAGRIKELIIRAGENIMPVDVEKAVAESDCIESVKVVGVPSEFFGEEVCACIVLKEGAVFDEDTMRRELEPRIARYKIPSYFLIYDSLPVLGSGKTDTVSLRADAAKRVDSLNKNS